MQRQGRAMKRILAAVVVVLLGYGYLGWRYDNADWLRIAPSQIILDKRVFHRFGEPVDALPPGFAPITRVRLWMNEVYGVPRTSPQFDLFLHGHDEYLTYGPEGGP